MTPLEALILLRSYEKMPYKSKAADRVIYHAIEVLDDAATSLMRKYTGQLCTSCWGDGFHRVIGMLSGPCHTCNGTGKRAPAPAVPSDQRGRADGQ